MQGEYANAARGRLGRVAGVRAIRMHYNSVYAVESGGSLVLIDTGPDYRGAWGELREALGSALPDLVIATHGHNDHASLGAAWQQAGVPVVVGAEDADLVASPNLHRPGELEALQTFARESGAPGAVAAEMVGALQRRFEANRRADTVDAYAVASPRWPTGLRFVPFQPDAPAGEATLPGAIEIVHCPGHTPGNLVVVERDEGWLFSGDQLLPDMTATPGIQFVVDAATADQWRFRSLPAFLGSLQALGKRQFSQCFPGHGPAFDDVAATIERNIATIEARTTKVARALSPRQPASAWSICEKLYRLAAYRRPWQLLATIQGHLDLLEARGEARAVEGGWLSR
jgi:glyoxylase-like metal-dependent hydrolase (beta-lactamase superfamily II)